MNHPRLIVLNVMEESISKQRGELTAASLLSTWLVVAAIIKHASASCTLKHGTKYKIHVLYRSTVNVLNFEQLSLSVIN